MPEGALPWAEAVADEQEPAFEPVPFDHPLCILYSSGTTGLPKGVMCAQAGYLATGHETARILDLTEDDRIFVYLPLFHTNPQMYALMGALTAGASLAIAPRFSASAFFEDARRLRAMSPWRTRPVARARESAVKETRAAVSRWWST